MESFIVFKRLILQMWVCPYALSILPTLYSLIFQITFCNLKSIFTLLFNGLFQMSWYLHLLFLLILFYYFSVMFYDCIFVLLPWWKNNCGVSLPIYLDIVVGLIHPLATIAIVQQTVLAWVRHFLLRLNLGAPQLNCIGKTKRCPF